MKLSELDARFVVASNCGPPEALRQGHLELPVDAPLSAAHGIWLDCPGCQAHSLLVWFRDRPVPAHYEPKPRWDVSGSSLADLTVTPSINLDVPGAVGCKWHGFITAGDAK